MINKGSIVETLGIEFGNFRVILKQVIIFTRKCDVSSKLHPRTVFKIIRYLGRIFFQIRSYWCLFKKQVDFFAKKKQTI